MVVKSLREIWHRLRFGEWPPHPIEVALQEQFSKDLSNAMNDLYLEGMKIKVENKMKSAESKCLNCEKVIPIDVPFEISFNGRSVFAHKMAQHGCPSEFNQVLIMAAELGHTQKDLELIIEAAKDGYVSHAGQE